MKSIKLLLPILILLLSGCAGGMLPGRMYTAQTGRVLTFSIQKSHGNGKMEAYDSQTGEKFTGEYSARYTGQGAALGSVGGSSVMLFSPPTGANAAGILVGDHGTTIRLYFEIKPGIRPTGHGTGQDQRGNQYEVYF